MLAARDPWADRSVAASLQLAAVALADLDAAVNGSEPPPSERKPLAVATLLAAARERWRAESRMRWPAEPAGSLVGDADRLGAALDNLIDNALRHGGEATVAARSEGGRALIEVANPVPPEPAEPEGTEPSSSRRDDPRHGHGLAVASGVVARHGGTLQRPRLVEGQVTMTLDLPSPRVGAEPDPG